MAPVDVFSVETLSLFATVPVRNLPAGGLLVAEWMYNETALDRLTTHAEASMGIDDGWIEFHVTRSEAELWPDGTYAISISLDGSVVQTAEVAVIAD